MFRTFACCFGRRLVWRTTHSPRARLGGPLGVLVLCVCLRWRLFAASVYLPLPFSGNRRFGATALRRNGRFGGMVQATCALAQRERRFPRRGFGQTRLGAAAPEAELPLVSAMRARGGGLASVACLGPLALTSCWCGWRRRSCCAVCVEASPGMAGIRALAQCPGGMPHAHCARISFCMSEFVPEQKSTH